VAMTRAMRKLYFTSARYRMLFGRTTASEPSRFVREISTDNIEINELKRAFTNDIINYTPGRSAQLREKHQIASEAYIDRSSVTAPGIQQNRTNVQLTQNPHRFTSETKEFNNPMHFSKGDSIEHKVFGRGMVINVDAAGGDALLEIAFDDTGTKRLMFNSAMRYLTKLQI